ncbi:MAG: HD domain-containing protein [candidate division WOR-3 bacterium]|nr:HD domain-containing protein [candidate division WOR-3 bacterium]
MGEIITFISVVLLLISAILSLIYSRNPPGKVWFFQGVALFSIALKYFLSLIGMQFVASVLEILILLGAILVFISVLFIPGIYREMEKTNIQLKGLWEIDRIIISGLTPSSILGSIKKTVAEVLGCDALAIYTAEPGRADLNVFTNYNLNEEFHNEIIGKNKDFLNRIIRTRKSQIVTGRGDDKNLGELLKKYGFTSCIGVPLILRGIPFGALLIFSHTRRNYDKQELQYMEGIARQLVITIDRIQAIEKMKEMSVEAVHALVQAIEMRDPTTKGHSAQVAELAQEIARKMDFPESKLHLIKFAGLLHDVGKIAVPESILRKPAELDEYEWVIVKKHPIHSMNIIKPINNLQEICKWVLHHHERWDGSGYPDGLKHEAIPIESRILAICDAYSAMVSDRPYRKGLTIEYALEEIQRCAGKQFDPEIVKLFLKIPEVLLKNLNEKNLQINNGKREHRL